MSDPGSQGYVDEIDKIHRRTPAQQYDDRCLICGRPTSNVHTKLKAYVCASHLNLTAKEIAFVRRQLAHTCPECKGKGYVVTAEKDPVKRVPGRARRAARPRSRRQGLQPQQRLPITFCPTADPKPSRVDPPHPDPSVADPLMERVVESLS